MFFFSLLKLLFKVFDVSAGTSKSALNASSAILNGELEALIWSWLSELTGKLFPTNLNASCRFNNNALTSITMNWHSMDNTAVITIAQCDERRVWRRNSNLLHIRRAKHNPVIRTGWTGMWFFRYCCFSHVEQLWYHLIITRFHPLFCSLRHYQSVTVSPPEFNVFDRCKNNENKKCKHVETQQLQTASNSTRRDSNVLDPALIGPNISISLPEES